MKFLILIACLNCLPSCSEPLPSQAEVLGTYEGPNATQLELREDETYLLKSFSGSVITSGAYSIRYAADFPAVIVSGLMVDTSDDQVTFGRAKAVVPLYVERDSAGVSLSVYDELDPVVFKKQQ